MKTVTDHIRHHLLDGVGLTEPRRLPSLDALRESEWCPRFEQFMRNRLLLGAFRYGLFGDDGKLDYDHLASIRKRLDAFEDDENLEHLVDVANLCMLEFLKGERRGMVVRPVDDSEHHCKAKQE